MEKILFGKNFDNNYQMIRENRCTTLGKRRFGKNGKKMKKPLPVKGRRVRCKHLTLNCVFDKIG